MTDIQTKLSSFGEDQELLAVERARRTSSPHAIRSVGIVGGGTAGYLSALILRATCPDVAVTLIESKKIPIIGVGEATVNSIVPFLHKTLGIDIHEFYREVIPTMKLGIKFEWGQPAPYHFQAPFDWTVGSVGLIGSMTYEGNVNSMSLGSLMMEHDKTFVIRGNDDGEILSLFSDYHFAYHLDNMRFVSFLHRKAVERGVRHLDTTIVDAKVDATGENITTLLTESGETLSFDLYVDCSGFRSMLLEGKLKSDFVSYADSLYTDRALAFNTPHGGHIKPYTTASTMSSGWCWTIPMPEDDHHGYVFSSRFCTPEEAERELREKYPDAGDTRIVKFRSGRHEEIWRGNVFAVGNSYAFVEPLESTGILMITNAAAQLARVVSRHTNGDAGFRYIVNKNIADDWDRLRWFLAIHYKYNQRLDTPFWKKVRADGDVSGVEHILQLYRENAPIRLLGETTTSSLRGNFNLFFGVQGFDCILLGQKAPTNLLPPPEPREAWLARKQVAMEVVNHALTMEEVVAINRDSRDILDLFVSDEESWINKDPLFSKFAV